MTRIISAIFVVYIALMSLKPCDEMFSRAVEIELRDMAAAELSGPEDSDCTECSPFCMCSCCHLTAAFGYTIRTFENGTAKFGASELIPEYDNADVLGYSNPIWQPPKA